MFEEAQLYSPVTRDDDGKVVVHLGQEHPGFNDPAYRARRNEIATAATLWSPGEPIPQIAYTEVENEIWRTVSRELRERHERYACREFLVAKAALGLPEDRVPQLDEVTGRLRPLTGFEYHPAAGLVPLRQFYGALADRVFHSTQYVRHPSAPLYTPEPDIIHEVIGHGKLRAYGAGILSSYGEIEEFRHMDIRPLNFYEMGTLEYDITRYQPVLYAAESMDHLEESVAGFFSTCDDDTPV